MNKKIVSRHSAKLDEDLDVIVYGTAGQPVIVFAPQGQAPEGLEEAGLVDELSDYLEAGVIQLFCVTNVDGESWASDGYAVERAERQEAYYQAVCDEVVPLVHEVNGTDARPLALGFDLGATHAAIFALRRPDLFQGCVCLSGVYDARRYFGDWMDATLYDNVPCAFLPNMPVDHPYVALYNQRQLLFCCGQEASEAESLRTTHEIDAQLQRLGVEAWCDYWGGDVSHTWFWWKKQIRYFLPIVLEDVEKTTAAEKAVAPKKPARKRATTTKKATTKKAAAKTAEKDEAVAEKAAAKKATTKAAATKAEATAEKPAAKKATTTKAEPATTAEKPAAKPAAKRATTKKAAEKPAEAAAAPLAKAEKPATPAKAAKAATPAKATKAATPAKAEKAAAPAKATAAKKPAAKKATTTKAAATKADAKAEPAEKPAAKAEPAEKPAAKAATTRKRSTSTK